MKEQNQFKSELQRAAYQEEVTPPASVWQKLATAMPPKGKRSASPWRLALLLFFLIVVTAAIFFRLNEPMPLGAFVLNAQSNNHPTGASRIDHDHQSHALVNEIEGDKTTISPDNTKESKSKLPVDKTAGDKARTNDGHTAPTPLAVNAREQKKNALTSSQTEDDIDSGQPTESAEQEQKNAAEVQNYAPIEEEMRLDAPTENNELVVSSQGFSILTQSATMLNLLPLWQPNPLVRQQQELITRPYYNQSIQKASKYRMYTDVYMGGGAATRRLSAVDPEMSSYLNLRDGSEQDLSWFESGIRVGLTARRWRFDLGLQYGQINAYMQHTYTGVRQMVAMEVIDPIGTPRIDSVLRFGTRERIVKNTYRDISIPLRVGYQFYQGRIGLTAYVGINPVFGLQHRGIILSADELDYNLQSDPEEWFSSRMRWYGTAQVQLSLPLMDKVAFLLDMGFIHDFNGIQSERNPIEQRYNMLRGSVGVRYFFEREATKCVF